VSDVANSSNDSASYRRARVRAGAPGQLLTMGASREMIAQPVIQHAIGKES